MLSRSKNAAQEKTGRNHTISVNATMQQVDVPKTICQYYNSVELHLCLFFLNA